MLQTVPQVAARDFLCRLHWALFECPEEGADFVSAPATVGGRPGRQPPLLLF